MTNRAVVILTGLIACCLIPSASACINDSETRGSENRFTSSYGNPSLASHATSSSTSALVIARSQIETAGLVGSLFGCALLGAGLYTAVIRQRALNAAMVEVQQNPDSNPVVFLD